ncbi:MAG: PQQ-binding-like beta-propeller repeat protein [Acidiferrobacterales bacterium]|nr:PQQ-binding-like beta-propeller repeat protein [Acidiferrobacterales bacterium]
MSLYLLASLFCAAATAHAMEDDWPLYGRKHDNQRFSPLTEIHKDNVSKLKLAWKFETGRKSTFQTSPIVKDGIMFLTTPFNDVIALDAESGAQRWRYQHTLMSDKYCCGPANRGPALADGRVYSVTIDGRLIALDQIDGSVIWDRQIANVEEGVGESAVAVVDVEEFSGAVQTGQTGYSANLAPQVHDGIVYIGITGAGYGLHLEQEQEGESLLSVGSFSGGGHGLRGFVVAYDGETGTELWRWYSVPEEGWEGEWTTTLDYGPHLKRDIEKEKKQFEKYRDTWKLGGGSVWTTPAIDAELGLMFVGTGNPSPQMDGSTRPGDNLYTVSLVALELKTGKVRWYYQQVPHDRWGYDVASPPVLFDYEQNGKKVKAIGQASKLGWFFIHDRATGELLRKSEPFVKQENLFALPSKEGTRIVPGTLGATSWSPVAYHPVSNWVYIAGIYQPSVFISRELTPQPGRPWESYTFFQKTGEPDWGTLTAIDVTNGEIQWQNKIADPMVGGVLVTQGGLLFTGEGNGAFNAYDSQTGELLWQHHSQYGVNAPPISYRVNGKQYVSVAAGGNKLFGYSTGDEVLTFVLDQ